MALDSKKLLNQRREADLIEIVDALLIAQYYVELITKFCQVGLGRFFYNKYN
jgi:hypothetical protein